MDDTRGHGKDERIRIENFYEGEEFLYRLVKALSGGGIACKKRPVGAPGGGFGQGKQFLYFVKTVPHLGSFEAARPSRL